MVPLTLGNPHLNPANRDGLDERLWKKSEASSAPWRLDRIHLPMCQHPTHCLMLFMLFPSRGLRQTCVVDAPKLCPERYRTPSITILTRNRMLPCDQHRHTRTKQHILPVDLNCVTETQPGRQPFPCSSPSRSFGSCGSSSTGAFFPVTPSTNGGPNLEEEASLRTADVIFIHIRDHLGKCLSFDWSQRLFFQKLGSRLECP